VPIRAVTPVKFIIVGKVDPSGYTKRAQVPLTQMGIRGLYGFIKRRLPHQCKALQINSYKGQTWGVDASCLLYKARAAKLSPLTVIAGLVSRLKTAQIQPIFIFDGRPPAAKAHVVEQRRIVRVAAQKEMTDIRTDIDSREMPSDERSRLEERITTLQSQSPQITSSEKDEIKSFLYAAGILFVTAQGEADDLLAYLCRDKQITAVISSDMDMLARGVPLLIIPDTADGTCFTALSMDGILAELAINYSQFVTACMLMGSDYSAKSWTSIEPVRAIEMVRRGIPVDISGSVVEGSHLLMGVHVGWDDLLSERQQAKWAAGVPPKEPETLAALCRTHGWPLGWAAL
jgi:5'-3' exonuclease